MKKTMKFLKFFANSVTLDEKFLMFLLFATLFLTPTKIAICFLSLKAF